MPICSVRVQGNTVIRKYRHSGNDSAGQRFAIPRGRSTFFIPKTRISRDEFESVLKVTDVFPLNGVGMTTARDNVVVDFEAGPLAVTSEDVPRLEGAGRDLCSAPRNSAEKKGWNMAALAGLLRMRQD